MKYPIAILLFLIYATAFGQITRSDLPKPVARILNNHYNKQKVVLKDISTNNFISQTDRFYKVYSADSVIPKGYLHLGTVNTCRAGGCSIAGESAMTDIKGEYFDYLIVFNTALAVEAIQVFNYQASYGHEIAARGWLKQFQGFRGEKALEPGKDIDIISGATISVHAITDDVQWKTKLLQQMLQ
jgi:hypothetical protein